MRETIDPKRAAALFNRLKCWKQVAAEMPRNDGTLFTPQALIIAVHRMDKGK